MTNIDREYILNSFLENIASASDTEYQKRVWIKGEGPECDDYDEFMNYFFDQGEFILKKYKSYGISNSQYDLLLKFQEKLDAFTPNEWDFINDPEWIEIVKMAKEVLKVFNWKSKKHR